MGMGLLTLALQVKVWVYSYVNLAEGSSGRCIERERVEIGFGLLEMRLPGRALRVGLGDQWADGQLGESHGGYHRHGRQMSGIC
jgi:hypothetical protein